MINDVRRLSVNLRPAVLDDFGLVVALGILVREFEKMYKISISWDTDGSTTVNLSDRQEIALYRIAQETLSNVAKHAHASRISMSLRKNGHGIMLKICDDGTGFSPDDSTWKPSHVGLGLISMRERTEELGGTFSVESLRGQGTTITATIPLNHETSSKEDPHPYR
jgi:two-component system NarL family sensor kinase